jgi:hypothetical protein
VVIDSNGSIIELTGNGTSLAHQSDGYGLPSTALPTSYQNLKFRTCTYELELLNGWGYGIFGGGSAVSGTIG